MLNILEVDPKITDTPTMALQYAVNKLKETAETEYAAEAERNRTIFTPENRIRNKYLAALDLAPEPISVPKFEEAVKSKITSSYGKKGPTENAFNSLHTFALRAYAAGYPLNNKKLQSAFMDFLMALVTEGFVGRDTTGTQMGNFRGEWRGGGFKD